jgi:hypothetical protein
MDSSEFFQRFADRQEVGRDLTDTHLSVFYDNGREVGCWREERRTTIGQGEILSEENADIARHWFKQVARGRQGRSL